MIGKGFPPGNGFSWVLVFVEKLNSGNLLWAMLSKISICNFCFYIFRSYLSKLCRVMWYFDSFWTSLSIGITCMCRYAILSLGFFIAYDLPIFQCLGKVKISEAWLFIPFLSSTGETETGSVSAPRLDNWARSCFNMKYTFCDLSPLNSNPFNMP